MCTKNILWPTQFDELNNFIHDHPYSLRPTIAITFRPDFYFDQEYNLMLMKWTVLNFC